MQQESDSKMNPTIGCARDSFPALQEIPELFFCNVTGHAGSVVARKIEVPFAAVGPAYRKTPARRKETADASAGTLPSDMPGAVGIGVSLDAL